MSAIVQRLALVAGSLCVVFAALALASTGEGDALPGVERAFTEPVAPAAKAEERLVSAQAQMAEGRPVANAVPLPADGPEAGASLLAWSRFQPVPSGPTAGR